jgi:hypothetical protein
MGRRRLPGGLERLFRDHRSRLGGDYREAYESLRAGLALDGDAWLQREASRAALLVVRARESARQWAQTIEQRKRGRGRRPSLRHVERAARRATLDDLALNHALDKLRELVNRSPARPLAELIEPEPHDLPRRSRVLAGRPGREPLPSPSDALESGARAPQGDAGGESGAGRCRD